MKLLLVSLILYTQLFSHNCYSEPILRGSKESQIKQNLEADQSNLSRIENMKELLQHIGSGLLISIPTSPGVKIDIRLDKRFHYVRPCTAEFIKDLGSRYRERFNVSLQINSAIRTVEHQKEIAKYNRNAAPTTGNMRSSHLTGSTIDISKKKLSRAQKKWLRLQLKKFERKDEIDATEEFHQAVFHIMVYDRYQQNKIQIVLQ